jgi:hypothetical protein
MMPDILFPERSGEYDYMKTIFLSQEIGEPGLLNCLYRYHVPIQYYELITIDRPNTVAKGFVSLNGLYKRLMAGGEA